MNLDLLDIIGAIRPPEAIVIQSLAEGKAHPDALFVEVGVWKGHSASLIGEVVKRQGGHLYCIDHWRGSEGTGLVAEAEKHDIYSAFEHNMKELDLWGCITPMKMDSETASSEFKDGSIDFFFLDADHRHKQFLDDLTNWTPKMKPGGIMCGHDCEGYYSKMTPAEQIQIAKQLDIDFGGYHAGVIKGLYDYFHDDYCIADKTHIWFKEI